MKKSIFEQSKFDRTHHKALWEYMAQEKTINEIIADCVTKSKDYTTFLSDYDIRRDITRDCIYDKKMEFFVQNNILSNDIPINCCYACQTSCGDDFIQNCDKCPVDLKGNCEEDNTKYVTKGNLYDRYIKYIIHIVMNPKNKDKDIKQAQKMALQIANANLRYDVKEI